MDRLELCAFFKCFENSDPLSGGMTKRPINVDRTTHFVLNIASPLKVALSYHERNCSISGLRLLQLRKFITVSSFYDQVITDRLAF